MSLSLNRHCQSHRAPRMMRNAAGRMSAPGGTRCSFSFGKVNCHRLCYLLLLVGSFDFRVLLLIGLVLPAVASCKAEHTHTVYRYSTSGRDRSGSVPIRYCCTVPVETIAHLTSGRSFRSHHDDRPADHEPGEQPGGAWIHSRATEGHSPSLHCDRQTVESS
eukprot:COSAG05_NODE_826_length_7102_cov_4.065829_5_plen_162_part_00